jgi:hypothetical protein
VRLDNVVDEDTTWGVGHEILAARTRHEHSGPYVAASSRMCVTPKAWTRRFC